MPSNRDHPPAIADFPLSTIGTHWVRETGIGVLMDDLGHALAGKQTEIAMLGGGNPARIPAMETVWQGEMQRLMASDDFGRMLGVYDPPLGNSRFREAMAHFLAHHCGWPVGPENIALTNGGQTAFFVLFNLLAGAMPDGNKHEVLLPLVPEYLGYTDQGLTDGCFRAVPGRIQTIGNREFKYGIDSDRLQIRRNTAALCLSRPSNPTGNVPTDAEMAALNHLASKHGIPLILDCAYGVPFPGIVTADVTPWWSESTITVLSLSKLGLPGTRTGIIVGPPNIIAAIGRVTALTGLANGNVGQALLLPLLEDGRLPQLVNAVIRPFYATKADRARAWLESALPPESGWRLHRHEGAFFFWLWLPNLPINTMQLYERLKAKGVLIVPGRYFAHGDPATLAHADRCLRLSFTMPDEVVERGIQILGEVVRETLAHL